MKILTKIISYLLSSLILFNVLQVSITFAYYKLDPKGFIEKLCENKDAPELECNGKCQLKKVVETNSNKTNIPNKLVDFKDIILYTETPYKYQLNILESTSKIASLYINHYNFFGYNDVFHPPQI